MLTRKTKKTSLIGRLIKKYITIKWVVINELIESSNQYKVSSELKCKHDKEQGVLLWISF